ncbi:FAD/NAD(P)-binding protein [Actinophytocola sp.]|uniref:FAD/NAD(P)-binding protein n=1 Tax=Actinophytocola sp. TaxID=1872138 RepID=UPI002ED00672
MGSHAIAIVGAGPRGIGLLERIAANAPELLHGRLTVHLVDPFPPGPGRVWRFAQSPLLRMNSMPEDVTMFTDDSVQCAGPIRPGPTLAEWVTAVRDGELAATVDSSLLAELRSVTATTFPTRRLQSAYLNWFHSWVLDALPDTVEVRVHATRAVDVTGPPDGVQTVWLADGRELVVDMVVLALGHLDAAPGAEEARLAEYARNHQLRYIPPAYTADLDLSDIEPAETVLSRGFGLAFVDLAVLLTESRGGRFRPDRDGTLTYHPSGREPVLYVGSRRGVPYHAKPRYRLQGPRPELPRFFGPPEIDDLVARPGRLDFRTDVWPLMAKEIGWGYYHELFTGHADKVRLDLDEFADRYAALDWDSTDMRVLVAKAVPDERDRLDLDAVDRPLRDKEFADRASFTTHVLDYVGADLTRRANPSYSADLGAFLTLLSVFGQLARLVAEGKLRPLSQVDDVDGWWFGFFSFFASGPPGHRLRELVALVEAGVVRLVGPDMWVRAEGGRFVAGSPAVPGQVEATTLVEARLPAPSVRRATDPLLRTMFQRGELAEEVLLDAAAEHSTGRILTTGTGLLVDATGWPHPRRFALGPHTSSRAPGAFTRPNTNAVGFRQNDAVARHILAHL